MIGHIMRNTLSSKSAFEREMVVQVQRNEELSADSQSTFYFFKLKEEAPICLFLVHFWLIFGISFGPF